MEMILELVIKNIKNSFGNFRKIYVLLIVSQLISIVSIFFVYGIYGSFSAKIQELDIESYVIMADFEESSIGELKGCLSDIMNEIGSKVDYIFVSGASDNKMLSMYTEYYGGKYTLSEVAFINNVLQEGRTLTYEDAINESKVVYSQFSDEHKTGDILNIAGTEFEIVGVDKRGVDDLIIPFNSCPDLVRLSLVCFSFKELPSEKDYYAIKDVLEENFGYRLTIDEFEIMDQEEIISYRTIIIISIAIGVLSALSTCLLYGYIITQRRKQMVVCGLVGATKWMRLMINELEIMLVNIAVVIIGFVIFKFGLQEMITGIYENSVELYSTNAYLIMSLIYITCIFVFITILLHILNRETLTDMLRRTKND